MYIDNKMAQYETEMAGIIYLPITVPSTQEVHNKCLYLYPYLLVCNRLNGVVLQPKLMPF